MLLRRQREEYGKFSKAAGLLTQNDRTQVYGYDRSKSAKTVWAERKANSPKNGLTNGGGSGMIREEERARHSQKYAVPQNLTESSSFTRKFISMTDDAELRRQFYQESKAMLHNRSGTNGEDLKYYNPRLKKWYRSTKGTEAGSPDYNNEILQGLSEAEPFELISFHNHPKGMPPSDVDLNCALQNKYKAGYTIGHNGTIFEYTAPKYYIDGNVYTSRVASYTEKGYSEFDAQLNALKDLQGIYQFEFREVK